MSRVVIVTLYILCFFVAMYATSSIQFDKLCNVKDSRKVQLLWIILSMGLAYLVANFLQVLLRI